MSENSYYTLCTVSYIHHCGDDLPWLVVCSVFVSVKLKKLQKKSIFGLVWIMIHGIFIK